MCIRDRPNNSAADCSILLKFYTGFEHMMSERPQKLKVKGPKVKVTARRKSIKKICQIVNNSAVGCLISIKFSTYYDHVPPDLPQTFKVNGSKLKVIT